MCVNGIRVPLKKVERMWQAFKSNETTFRELKLIGCEKVYFVNVERDVCLSDIFILL